MSIQTGGLEDILRYDERKRREREEKEKARLAKLRLLTDIHIKVSDRNPATSWRNPSTPRENAEVYLALKKLGFVSPSPQVLEIADQLEAQEKAEADACLQPQLEGQAREIARQNQPHNIILRYWRQHSLQSIEAMDLDKLEQGYEIITAEHKGIPMNEDELLHLRVFLNDVISKKRLQSQPMKKKKKRLGFF